MLISLVTVHLDDLEGLRATSKSIQAHDESEQLEWIVVDGGTRVEGPGQEATWRMVQTLASTFISEPDQGLYDAMNKGTAAARGDYVIYLNAGDTLHQGFSLPDLAEAMGSAMPCMVWGNSYDSEPSGEPYLRKTRAPWWLRYGTAIAHQAILFERQGLGRAPYDLQYPIAADYDLVCRLYQAGGDILRLDMPVCIFQLGGLSSLDPKRTLAEESFVRQKVFGIPPWLGMIIGSVKRGLWSVSRRFPGFRRRMRRHF